MKKAVIEQFLLGFILIFATITFVATVGDEISAKNKAKNIQRAALQTAKTMSSAYNQTINMCWAKTMAENILLDSKLGIELLKLNETIPGSFTYDFYDFLPINTDGSVKGDNQPDTVIVNVSNYSHENFWYKFLDKKSFTISNIQKKLSVDAPFTLTIEYGGGDSGNDNMVGTYELDEHNCVTNTKVLVPSQNSYDEGTTLATGIETPPTYFFIIPNGGNIFRGAKKNDEITLSPKHCIGSDSTHSITIGDKTATKKVHFQQNNLNNGDSFVQVIPANVWDIYNDYVEPAEGKRSTYDKFLEYCKTEQFQKDIKDINEDDDKTNDIIDCITDINGQYKYAFEDWDAGDDDFNDVFLDSTQIIIKNSQDDFSVDENTRKIIFDEDYCETDPLNNPPSLILEECPVDMDEDTTIQIPWTATDTDGIIESKSVVAENLSSEVSIDANNSNTIGTVTYTPPENYFGEDKVTVIITDDDGALARRDCEITINEVNDPPTIEGTPASTVKVGNDYYFKPTAEDVDGDPLTFSIKNKPSWASFNETTGELTGTPNSSEIGIYENIIITVDDGRGGSTSLSSFKIEVVTNLELTKNIPDLETNEGDSFSHDMTQYFQGASEYTIVGTRPTSVVIDKDSGEFTYTPRSDYSDIGEYKLRIVVKDSAGNSVTSNQFTFTINNDNDLPSFILTFDSDTQGWTDYLYSNISWKKYNNDGKLKIAQDYARVASYSYYTFDFGWDYRYKDVSVEYDLYYSGGWENSGSARDYLFARLNYVFQGYEYYRNNGSGTDGPVHKTYTARTDYRGRIRVELVVYTTDTNETIYLDNVKVKIQ